METRILPTATFSELAFAETEACRLFEAGEVVALPTETVYGLAADALRPDAVAKIFEAKERPFFDPLICHLPSLDWLDRLARIPDESRNLVEALISRFWPGPLTLVLPRQPIVPDLVTAGLETVAMRYSAHPVFRAICGRFGKPLAAPSANRFGRISPTAAIHVEKELGGRIPLIVDGGATAHGLESTIVAIEGAGLRLLRSGPVTPEDLAEAASKVDAFLAAARSGAPKTLATAMEAPGQMSGHYAPRTPLRLLTPGADPPAGQSQRLGSLAFHCPSAVAKFACEEILSPSGDLREAAATLFAKLRRLDEAGLDLILAEPVPENGLGLAIMDRLRKASTGSLATEK